MRLDKYPEDFRQDIRDMLSEGLSIKNVADYLGAPKWLVDYLKNTKGHARSSLNWRLKNPARAAAIQYKANKKYYALHHKRLKAKSMKYYYKNHEKRLAYFKKRRKQKAQTPAEDKNDPQ